MVDNIVIGKPIVSIKELVGKNEKTFHTETRFLPEALRESGVTTHSNGWFKKNKPHLAVTLTELDCFEIKLGKKLKPIFIIVGE